MGLSLHNFKLNRLKVDQVILAPETQIQVVFYTFPAPSFLHLLPVSLLLVKGGGQGERRLWGRRRGGGGEKEIFFHTSPQNYSS